MYPPSFAGGSRSCVASRLSVRTLHRRSRGASRSRGGVMSAERSEQADSSFVDAVARRVVELLREEAVVSREGPRLLTVAAVSQEFGVSTDWVYANAGRLGAIRLGSGPRARLRFDRATTADRIAKVGSRAARDRSSPRGMRPRGAREGADGDLLPILG